MKNTNILLSMFPILIYISLFPTIISYLTQFNSTELESFNKFLNRCELINLEVKKYEKRMKNIKFNLKLKTKFRHIKEDNKKLLSRLSVFKKTVNKTEFDKNQIFNEMDILQEDLSILAKKIMKFNYKYKSYEQFKSTVLEYIKIFFICFFSVVAILVVILIILGIYMYRKGKKYKPLVEEITLKQEIKSLPNNNIDNFNKSDKSENRNLKPTKGENTEKNIKI